MILNRHMQVRVVLHAMGEQIPAIRPFTPKPVQPDATAGTG